MTSSRAELAFLLNDREIRLGSVKPEDTLLDFLRLGQKLRGTKEGCAEGDCGACTVLVGKLGPSGLVYEPVNSCIRFMGSLDGCHVVTVEHVARPDGLHPVQAALVEHHGSQCGFCTPGFVMSLYGLWMSRARPDDADIEKALQGNLCRCTGYEPIVKAAKAALAAGGQNDDRLSVEREAVTAKLAVLNDGRRTEITSAAGRIIIPSSADDLALAYAENPDAILVAGSTDVGLWVTKRMKAISPAIFIGGIGELAGISVKDGMLHIGATATYREAQDELARHFPALGRLIERIGGEQVRAMGTIGGNIANGSPIGDMPPALIALDAQLVLRRGAVRRRLALEDYFIAYGKQDRQPGEFVEAVEIPLLQAGAIFAVHKISKRRDEDITATLGAFHVRLDGDNSVRSARIAYGGMAATPKRAKAAEAALTGEKWTRGGIEAAMAVLGEDFQPISDMRASADYRMLAARNLLKRTWLESVSGSKPVSLKRHAEA